MLPRPNVAVLEASPRGPSRWISSSVYDLVFFSTVWLWAIFAVWCQETWVVHTEASFLVASIALTCLAYHLLLRLPHFVATLKLTYLERENWGLYRSQPFRYFIVPLLILVLYIWRDWGGMSEGHWGVKTLKTLATVWGLQHIAFQNYGIQSIYRMRATDAWRSEAVRSGSIVEKEFWPKWPQKMEKAVYYLLLFTAVFEVTVGIWWEPTRAVAPYLAMMTALVRGASLLLAAAYIAMVWIDPAARPFRSIPAALYLVSAVATMTYWPFYSQLSRDLSHTTGIGDLGTLLYFFVFNGHHCLAYLGLVYFVGENGRVLTSGSLIPQSWSVRRFPWFWALTVVGAVALMVPVFGTAILKVGGAVGGYGAYVKAAVHWLKNVNLASFRSLEGVFVVHYYLESISWRMADPRQRKFLGMRLGQISSFVTRAPIEIRPRTA